MLKYFNDYINYQQFILQYSGIARTRSQHKDLIDKLSFLQEYSINNPSRSLDAMQINSFGKKSKPKKSKSKKSKPKKNKSKKIKPKKSKVSLELKRLQKKAKKLKIRITKITRGKRKYKTIKELKRQLS